MSHHFDTPTGREDPKLNLADLYLFDASPGRTVMAMTVNPEAAPGMAAPFRPEGLHVFRFDSNNDALEDVSFKAIFNGSGQSGSQAQSIEIRRATGPDARGGAAGELLAKGTIGEVIAGDSGVLAFAGVTQDQFAGDGSALESFEAAFAAGKYTPEAFRNHVNLFESRHIAVIVLEVPTELVGTGLVHGWATVSLHGHAPEVQVARWGLPLITHLYIRDAAMREDYNRTPPSAENGQFTARIADVVRESARLAGSAADPAAYAQRVLGRFGSLTLPYRLGTPASFDYVGFNGRRLGDDVMDVMLTLTTNSALGDGVAPDQSRVSNAFPYFATPA